MRVAYVHKESIQDPTLTFHLKTASPKNQKTIKKDKSIIEIQKDGTPIAFHFISPSVTKYPIDGVNGIKVKREQQTIVGVNSS